MGKHAALFIAISALFACSDEQPQSSQPVAASTPAAPVSAPQATSSTPPVSEADAPQPERMSQEQREALISDRQFQEGRHYSLLTPQQPTVETDDGRIEVVEVFQYSCPACFNFEPFLEEWNVNKADYVNFVRVPAPWGELGELHARAYYTAEALGISDQTHAQFFREYHTNRNFMQSEDALADFFAGFGIDSETFRATFNSFSIHAKMQRARDLTERYRVNATPGMVVAGKYNSSGSMAESYGNWFAIVDELAAIEWANAD